MCAQNQNFQHFRMAKPSVSPSPWSLEQQLFFLHCFPMAQPPGEAPDRNQKKQQQMCFFWFRFFASLVTGPLHQQPFVFSRIVFNGPGIKSRNKTETETYLAKLATRKKKGKVVQIWQSREESPILLKVFVVFNKKELPAGARFVSVFLVVFRLVCVHCLRHIPSSIANRNSEKTTILFSFWPRLFWKCVLCLWI